MESKNPHRARICCLYSYSVSAPLHHQFYHARALFLLDARSMLELRCWRTGEWWDSVHPPLQKMRPVLHTRFLLVCLCGFTVCRSCGARKWKKTSLCLERGHPGQLCCHQRSQCSSPPLPLSHEWWDRDVFRHETSGPLPWISSWKGP